MLCDSRMSDKAVNRCFFVFDSIRDQYKTQGMYDTVQMCDNFWRPFVSSILSW